MDRQECIRTLKKTMLSKMADLLETESYNGDQELRKLAKQKLDHIEEAIKYLEENLK